MFISKHSTRTVRLNKRLKWRWQYWHIQIHSCGMSKHHTLVTETSYWFSLIPWFKRPLKQTTVFSHAWREEHSQMAKVLKPLKGPGLYDADLVVAQVPGTNNKASSGKQAPMFSSNGHHFTVCLGNRLHHFLLTVIISLYVLVIGSNVFF